MGAAGGLCIATTTHADHRDRGAGQTDKAPNAAGSANEVECTQKGARLVQLYKSALIVLRKRCDA